MILNHFASAESVRSRVRISPLLFLLFTGNSSHAGSSNHQSIFEVAFSISLWFNRTVLFQDSVSVRLIVLFCHKSVVCKGFGRSEKSFYALPNGTKCHFICSYCPAKVREKEFCMTNYSLHSPDFTKLHGKNDYWTFEGKCE